MPPIPNDSEKRPEFISRCVRELKHEDSDRSTNECLGQCYGVWESHKEKSKKGEKK